MLKMRTEPANTGGGGTVAYSQPVVLTDKSQQDVEAAYAIAQLSEQDPRGGADCHEPTASYKADSRLANGTWSPPRFSHLRTAVMPQACSRVEKAAVKRKFDWRDEGAAAESHAYKFPRRDMADPVDRAIASERDSFMTARRHQYLPRTDETELVGRFVRTCAPSGRQDVRHQLYVTVSDPTVSPTLVSSVPSLVTTSGSSRMTLQDEKPPVLSPAATEHSYATPSVSKHQRRAVCRDNSDALHLWHARRTTTPKHPVVLPQRHHMSVPSTRVLVPVSYTDSMEKLQGRGTFKFSTYEDDARRRRERLSSSLASAYYSLGQIAAAAAASQLPHAQSAVSNSRAQLTSFRQSQRPARVDSLTLSKVRRGEFGVLSTLRRYCSQLRRHSEPADVNQSADHDNDVAVDLSMRKRTEQSDAAEPQSDAVGAAWYDRMSRSCSSSPSAREGEVFARRWTLGEVVQRSAAVQHQMSSFSLPCSPYTGESDNERHRGLLRPRQHAGHDDATAASAAAADDSVADERTDVDLTDVIPDSQLPLKKRRLHYHHQQDQLPVISEDSCDKKWSSETSIHELTSSSSSVAAGDDQGVSKKDTECMERYRAVFLRRDEDGDLPLHIAVAKGTATAVDSIISVMLSLGVSLDYCNNRHQTALHMAVLTDQADMVGRLLDCGASSDVVDARGQTCVHVAVLLGTTSCLRRLLKCSRHPLDINAISYDGVTALHLAVQRGNTDAVRCLLSAGADVDVVDTKYGRTALYYAVQCNNMATAELLLSHGANPAMVPYSRCTTPIVQAAYSSKCSTDMLQRLQPAINYHQPPACCPTG